jgi:hypothetical protein
MGELADRSLADLGLLYLGNILYALERTAMDLDGEAKPDDAAFYRGIARVLTDAFAREKKAAEAAKG